MEHKKQKVKNIIDSLKKLFPEAKTVLTYSNTFEFLVAVMLSAQTTDKQVNKVTPTLFKKYPTVADYAHAHLEEFQKDISSIGFYRNKAKNIIATAQIIHEKYHGEVPHTMEELIELPGVGRKTANVILGNAFGAPVGIAVDTHVKRLSKLLGLTSHTDPKKIEQDLMKIVPKEEWTRFTHLLIFYGRTYCTARPHDHTNCPLYSFQVKHRNS